MLKDVKYAIVTNITLSLLFALSSFYLWSEVNEWNRWNIGSIWSPWFIASYRNPDLPTVQMPVGPEWNVPFMLFWVMLTVNLYFILKLQRANKQQKQRQQHA
jgi:hypothetical protein